ncbi:MAG: hypothetical protein R3B74_16780 [Nitrospirales bacterium]|nr:hypothetical protein [Nitrospirales bacterium]
MDIDKSKRQEAIDTASAIIKGALHPLEGCRRLVELKDYIGLGDDESFDQIRSTESETDHLPLGALKAHCSASYLERVQREEREYLESALGDIVKACEEIIQKLKVL